MLLKTIAKKVDNLIEEFGLDLKANSLTRFGLVYDIFVSHVLYGANVTDYFLHQFYKLKHRAKKTYMTQWDRMYMMNYVNNLERFDLFEDKRQFVDVYGKYMGRSTCILADGEEAYYSWLEQNPSNKYIFKPADGCCGDGIFVLPKDSEKLRDYAWLMELDDSMVVEPFMENCEELKRVYPGTLNTLRIPTLFKNGEPVIIGSYLRMGVSGIETDNYSNGGILCEVDTDSGVVITMGNNKKGQRFVAHPDTGEMLVGVKIPMWEEVKALVLEVAKITPDVIYSAWDIAVLPTGPVLIEGNIGGDVDLQQTPRGIGKRALYQDFLPKKRQLHFGYDAVAKPMRDIREAKEAAKEAAGK